MDITPEVETQPGSLRFLKVLVIVLTLTMIVGFIVLIGLIVMRFSGEPTAPLPDHIALPSGAKATAVTRGPDWFAVVTDDGRILILGLDGKTVRQEIHVETGH
jgi:hypothetical protein